MQLSKLNNQVVHQNLKSLCRSERAITAEILTYIAEVYRRKIHLQMGYGSLLSYLMKEMGYSKSAALRRMDGAKILAEIPELKHDFEDGTLNLTQASMFAQGVRQKTAEQKKGEKRSTPEQVDFFTQPEIHQPEPPPKAVFSREEKKGILNKLRRKTIEETQKTLAQELDLKVQIQEKKRYQRDDSVRVEMTFTQEQFQELERAKELLSHVHPGGKLSDIMAYAIHQLLERKDPLRKARKKMTRQGVQSKSTQDAFKPEPDLFQAVDAQKTDSGPTAPSVETLRYVEPGSVTDPASETAIQPKASRRYSAVTKQAVFTQSQECQWCDPKSGQRCGSRFQVQIDDVQPVWAGGSDDPENLQILCAAHNRFKYQREARMQSHSIGRYGR